MSQIKRYMREMQEKANYGSTLEQAMHLRNLHAHGKSDKEICEEEEIAEENLLLSRKALALAVQYQNSEYGDQFTENHFLVFYSLLKMDAFREIREWLAWDDEKYVAINQENAKTLFSLMSAAPDSARVGDYLSPAITKRDDFIWLLPVIKDESALATLIRTHDLKLAHSTSESVLRKQQDTAIQSISKEVDVLSQLVIRSENLADLEKALAKLKGIVSRAENAELSGIENNHFLTKGGNRHFDQLTIKKYRKINKLSLKKISRINLLAGLNNSGKTSVLEAIYLLVQQNDVTGLLSVIRNRGKVPEERINMEWLVEQLVGDIEVEGVFDQQKTHISVHYQSDSSAEVDKSRYLSSIEISAQFGNTGQYSITQLLKGRDRETRATYIKLLSKVVYSSPFFLNEPQHYVNYYQKSVQSNLLPQILDFIRQYISPSVSDIRLVDDRQRFLVVDSQFRTPQDLANYGEGLQRIFFLSLLFAAAQDGVLLIDEFENAIHTELLSKFIPFIHRLATEFNVQVFLTSHSKECIDAFAQTVPTPEDFTFHTLLTDDEGDVVVREFDGKKFSRLLEIGDIDLRRMR